MGCLGENTVLLVILEINKTEVLEPHLFSPLFILGWVTGGLADVHAEHDNLGGHGGHLVGEAVLVDAVHVSSKCVFSIGLPFSLKCEIYETVSTQHCAIQHRSISSYGIVDILPGGLSCRQVQQF